MSTRTITRTRLIKSKNTRKTTAAAATSAATATKPPQTQPGEMQLQISRVLEGGNKGISESKKLESTKRDSNAVQKLRAFRKQKPRQSISKPSSTVEKVENPKLHSCLKCGETFEWGSDYLRHNRLVHIQAKINSLYSMIALEPVTWS